jgi:hypothetical protein
MKAIEAANLANTSGLYIIRPRWAGRRALYKFGLTRNVTRRMLSLYRHSWPYAAGSFEPVQSRHIGDAIVERLDHSPLHTTVDAAHARVQLDILHAHLFVWA